MDLLPEGEPLMDFFEMWFLLTLIYVGGFLTGISLRDDD